MLQCFRPVRFFRKQKISYVLTVTGYRITLQIDLQDVGQEQSFPLLAYLLQG